MGDGRGVCAWGLSRPAGYTGTHNKIKSSSPVQVFCSGPLNCNDIAMRVMRSPARGGKLGQTRRNARTGAPTKISLRNPVQIFGSDPFISMERQWCYHSGRPERGGAALAGHTRAPSKTKLGDPAQIFASGLFYLRWMNGMGDPKGCEWDMVSFDRVRTWCAKGLTKSTSPKILWGVKSKKSKKKLSDVLGARVVAT